MPKGLRNLRIAFEEPQLTHFAGMALIHAFCTRLCLPPAYRNKTLKTVRMELLVIPGRLVNAKNRYRLKLPRGYHFEKTFQFALAKIQKLRPVEIR